MKHKKRLIMRKNRVNGKIGGFEIRGVMFGLSFISPV